MPPKESYADRVFTTEAVSYPEIVHIGENKDFTPIIEKALALGGYPTAMRFTGINGGEKVTTGFAHSTVLSVADTVIDAVKSGAIKVAVALADAFGCGVNDLPLSMVLSWYEQKTVCILLTLLHLGIKNILLGPSLPAFISPNVLNFLSEQFHIAPISTPEKDLRKILG